MRPRHSCLPGMPDADAVASEPAALQRALEAALASCGEQLSPSLSCQLAWRVGEQPTVLLSVAEGQATLRTAERGEIAADACALEFDSEAVFADAMSGRARTATALASGAMRVASNPHVLRQPELRPLLAALREAVLSGAAAVAGSTGLQITIAGAEREDEADGRGGQYTAFVVRLEGPDGSPPIVARKRFSEFLQLQVAVQEVCPDAALAPLPPKRFFHNDEVIRERQLMLTAFLRSVVACDALLSSAEGAEILASFLGVSGAEWVGATTVAPLAHSGPKAARDGRAAELEEEVQELTERVEQLESTIKKMQDKETAESDRRCREKADALLSLGWRCFAGVGAVLAVYCSVYGRSARFAWLSLAALGGSALYMRYSRSMLRRMIVGFSVWGVVMVNYRRTKRLTAPERMSEAESDAVWEEVHKIHSIFCCANGAFVLRISAYAFVVALTGKLPPSDESIVHLQGWWVKAGQYLSSRADVMPPSYLKELGKLQDSIPARPMSEVLATIREELPADLAERLLGGLEEEALAAASIAQVHRVELKPEAGAGGEPQVVALKIQHRGVAEIMAQDMKQMDLMIRIVAYFEPEFDFSQVVKEWCAEASKELDFNQEAKK